MKYKYIITSGWWCTDDKDERLQLIGSESIRSKQFHDQWFKAIENYASPVKTYLIDSASPIKPNLRENVQLFSLLDNAGHSTNHKGKLCGVSRAHLLGMMLASVNEVDYWVYIEQDALIKGEGIIEQCISKMKKPYMFGSGVGTPQVIQQSLIIIKSTAIPTFIKNYYTIKATDNDISPEMKMAIAASPFLMFIPVFIFKIMNKRSFLGKIFRTLFTPIFSILRGYDFLPYGYGRKRPINFDDKFYYFQHGTNSELDEYLSK